MSRGDRVGIGQVNISLSMRQNYNEYGVEEYYKKVGASYRNPHYPGIRYCLFTWFNRWREMEEAQGLSKEVTGDRILVFDMACGRYLPHSTPLFSPISNPGPRTSGEVTVAFKEWYTSGRSRWVSSSRPTTLPLANAPNVVRSAPNRQRTFVKAIGPDFSRPLITAADPFTADAFQERTLYQCAELSFKDISEGALPTSYTDIESGAEMAFENTEEDEEDAVSISQPKIEMVICSFALHLIQSPSELFALLWELSTKARWLVILAPHKKPEIKGGWGWMKWDITSWSEASIIGQSGELLNERVHCRVYRSTHFS